MTYEICEKHNRNRTASGFCRDCYEATGDGYKPVGARVTKKKED